MCEAFKLRFVRGGFRKQHITFVVNKKARHFITYMSKGPYTPGTRWHHGDTMESQECLFFFFAFEFLNLPLPFCLFLLPLLLPSGKSKANLKAVVGAWQLGSSNRHLIVPWHA